MARRILLGRIAGAHGVRCELRIQSYTAEPEAIAAYGPLADKTGRRTFRLALRGRVRGDQLIVHIEGVDDRNAAEALKGTELYVDRTKLPETDDPAEYYEADLIGLRVEDRNGNALGIVAAIDDFGAGPFLSVRDPAGGELLLPFTDAVVPEVDLAVGRLVVDPPAEIEPPAAPPEATRNAGRRRTDGRQRGVRQPAARRRGFRR